MSSEKIGIQLLELPPQTLAVPPTMTYMDVGGLDRVIWNLNVDGSCTIYNSKGAALRTLHSTNLLSVQRAFRKLSRKHGTLFLDS